ncbi:hypothetical protein A0H81_04131 [Grifola frondosa]|uniref:Uncharacterized protein n=1 Tax=Grifola frondosa TaxID=5627 RepID=A0A1C7MGA1_GRIFR|nr:hypothetical protein A0H81_04131 [Grifola frondosa]
MLDAIWIPLSDLSLHFMILPSQDHRRALSSQLRRRQLTLKVIGGSVWSWQVDPSQDLPVFTRVIDDSAMAEAGTIPLEDRRLSLGEKKDMIKNCIEFSTDTISLSLKTWRSGYILSTLILRRLNRPSGWRLPAGFPPEPIGLEGEASSSAHPLDLRFTWAEWGPARTHANHGRAEGRLGSRRMHCARLRRLKNSGIGVGVACTIERENVVRHPAFKDAIVTSLRCRITKKHVLLVLNGKIEAWLTEGGFIDGSYHTFVI